MEFPKMGGGLDGAFAGMFPGGPSHGGMGGGGIGGFEELIGKLFGLKEADPETAELSALGRRCSHEHTIDALTEALGFERTKVRVAEVKLRQASRQSKEAASVKAELERLRRENAFAQSDRDAALRVASDLRRELAELRAKPKP